PVVGPAAGLHHHLGGRLLGEERFHLLALEVALQDGAFPLIHAMECEDVLGGIDGNALKFHGTVLGWWFDNPTLALDAVGPSTSTTDSTSDPSGGAGLSRILSLRHAPLSPSWPGVSLPRAHKSGTSEDAPMAGSGPA